MISALNDSASREYKKARRQHWKSTKNRPIDVDASWSPFRAAEKKYKARFPPPDLSAVLDLASLLNANLLPPLHQPTRISAKGSDAFILPDVPGLVLLPAFVSPQDQRRLVRWSLRDHARRPNETNLDTHYVLPPEGVWNAHLQSRTSTGTESPLIRTRASFDCKSLSRSPSSGPRQLISNDPASVDNFSSLQSLQKPPSEPSTTVSDCPPSDLVSKLRWANIGWSYHWGSKQYDFSRGKGEIDPFLRDLCKRAVGTVRWEEVFDGDDLDGWGNDDWRTWTDTYEPDAGIVNFYQTKDTLMAHVDRSEVCATSPLVSISLGNAAIFLIGGLTRDTEPIPILLRSGDVLIMSGPACRRAYHGWPFRHHHIAQSQLSQLEGVPRILETTLPEHFSQPPDGDDETVDWEPYKDYMCCTRININVRQVFPKGFNPGL
ncbi:hypothetical protein J3R83DRAFT_4673 [Lanmaoa asiatica]|nr:hypothetical protein J3R83DRAFT_4673 [Lanmaoa asiatica]